MVLKVHGDDPFSDKKYLYNLYRGGPFSGWAYVTSDIVSDISLTDQSFFDYFYAPVAEFDPLYVHRVEATAALKPPCLVWLFEAWPLDDSRPIEQDLENIRDVGDNVLVYSQQDPSP